MQFKGEVVKAVDRVADELVAASRFLHQHPELAYEEREAAQRLTALLKGRGFEVIEGAGGFRRLPGQGRGRAAVSDHRLSRRV
jgi:metal-dependent amidase/aminoacylase/carboxypeptidase family protein